MSNIPEQDNLVGSSAELGAAIRCRRKALGLRLTDAAGLCGVGVRFLSELENGKSSASLGKALQVLSGLGLQLHLRPRGLHDDG